MNRRKDNKGVVLKEGESQRANGSYDYRYIGSDGRRHAIYAPTLKELREKKKQIIIDEADDIHVDSKRMTINDMYKVYVELKRGVKDNTLQNYCYMYDRFVAPDFGNTRLSNLKKSDVQRFYNHLVDDLCLKIRSVENVHIVLYQVLQKAVDDGYLRTNVASNCIKDLKSSHNYQKEKKMSLTLQQQKLFERYIEAHPQYSHWYPIFIVMLYTGMRVGEVTGLRWCDIDFKHNVIHVTHTLVYYPHGVNGCSFGINTPKTVNSYRTIPMTNKVREALSRQKKLMKLLESRGVSLDKEIDGYTNFVFINRFGNVQNQTVLNKALRRIMRDCNDEILEKSNGNVEDLVLLPRFSCHTLRHTFATRLCEKSRNLKAIQSIMGHSDIRTTMDIYADATNELKQKEMKAFENLMVLEDIDDTPSYATTYANLYDIDEEI